MSNVVTIAARTAPPSGASSKGCPLKEPPELLRKDPPGDPDSVIAEPERNTSGLTAWNEYIPHEDRGEGTPHEGDTDID